jgi:hypothetical protein
MSFHPIWIVGEVGRLMDLQDTSLHETIQKACDDMLRFLDNILESNSTVERNVQDVISTLADLRKHVYSYCFFVWYIELTSLHRVVHTSSLSMLFQYRKVFHRIAARAVVPGTTAHIIICWVDVLLVKLNETIIFVAGGFRPGDPDGPSLLPSLKAQRENDKLLAAAQLPRECSVNLN